MKRIVLAALAGFGLIFPAKRLVAEPLQIGDEAPEIQVGEWIRGDPVSIEEGVAGKKITVVEFWATWCPPCRASIPHLSGIYERFAERGVQMVGISSEDAETVRAFVEEMPFSYPVAADPENKTSSLYMEGIQGIPHAFVVDGSGKIAWTGHPMGELESVIEQLLAGTYDFEKSRELEKAKKDMQKAAQKQDIPGTIAAAKKVLEMDPNASEAFQMLSFLYQHTNNPGEFKKCCSELIERPECGPPMLNFVAWSLVSVNPLSFRDVGLALRAVNLALEKDENAAFVDTLARVYFELGKLDLAVSTQEKAVEVSSESERPAFQDVLEYYRSVQLKSKEFSVETTE